MNVVFGSASKLPEKLHVRSGSDGGVVLGSARDSGAELVFLGTLHAPLEGWDGPPAVEDAQRSAHYLLDRYRRLDEKFLDGVVGQYAVAVSEPAKKRLWLAVDPAGHRTLYIWRKAGRCLFSSNLRQLAETLGDDLEVDRSLEDFLLLYGFYPWGRTPFRDVTALSRGTLLRWEDGEETRRPIVFSNPWHDRYDAGKLEGASEQEVIDVLYQAFMDALSEQNAASSRVGVLLGGFDSALVAACLKRLGKEVHTFSFHYEDARYNQPFTDLIARTLGIQHHWVPLTQARLERGLHDFSASFNQPTNWPNYVIQTLDCCAEMRAAGIGVAYSGDGCDSIFLGYPGTYRRAVVFERAPTLSPRARDALLRVAAIPALDRRLGHPYRIALNLIRALGRPMPQRGYLSFRILDEISLDQLRSGDRPPQEKSAEEIAYELAQPFANLPSLRLAYLGKAAVSPNRNKMVGSSDATGVAILSPYMHPGLKELALNLPESLCRPNQTTASKVTGKHILMRMAEVRGLLPKEVIYQPKKAAVDGPIDDWYAGPLRRTIEGMLEDLPFTPDARYVRALLRPKLAEKLFRRYFMTDKVISHAVSLLATYSRFTALARNVRTT